MHPVTCYRWQDAARVAWLTGRAPMHQGGRWHFRLERAQ